MKASEVGVTSPETTVLTPRLRSLIDGEFDCASTLILAPEFRIRDSPKASITVMKARLRDPPILFVLVLVSSIEQTSLTHTLFVQSIETFLKAPIDEDVQLFPRSAHFLSCFISIHAQQVHSHN
jgi:hypothetical protein